MLYAGGRRTDLHDDVHSAVHLAEDRVLRLSQVVAPPIQEIVVHGIDKKLRAAGVGLPGVNVTKMIMSQ